MYKKIVILFLIGMLLTGCSKTADAVESTIEEVISEEVTESTDAETIVEEEETSETIVVEESTIETEEEKAVLPIITEYNENAVDITDADLSIEYNGFMLTPYTTVSEVVKGLGYPDGYEANNDGFIAYTDDYRWNLIYPYFDATLSEYDFRIVMAAESGYHDEQTDDRMEGYIDFIDFGNYNTLRGSTVGDDISKVADLYGKPDREESYSANNKYMQLVYVGENGEIIFCLDESNTKVDILMIDYYEY